MERSVQVRIKLLQLYFNTFGLLQKKRSAKQLLTIFSTPRSRVIREKETAVLKKTKCEKLEFDGDQISTYQWGDGRNIALLCHGWESNAGSLGAFVPLLTQSGYKVVSYDGPAHGSSGGKQANLITFKAVAKAVVQAYGKPELAIGHSLGANVVMLLSKEEQLELKKSILISPVNRIETVFDGFKHLLKIPDSIHRQMIELINQKSNYRVNQLEFSEIAGQSPIQSALIMHDIGDRITDFSHSESLNANWKQAQLKPIEGSGHYKILWHPKSLQSAIEYLRK